MKNSYLSLLRITKVLIYRLKFNETHSYFVFFFVCVAELLYERENYSLITAAISAIRPDLYNLLPSKDVVNIQMKPSIDYPLEASLEKCFGGKQYLKTGVYSNLGLHIGNLKKK